MMIEVTGDLLLTDAEAIAHGVSPNDNFHQGLALALRERWPQMYNDFRHYCHQHHPKEGEIVLWGGEGKQVIHLLTQDGAYGQGEKPGKASLKNVGHALKELEKWLKKEKPKSLAMPRLATGVGGLDWADVKPLMEQHLAHLDTKVYVYVTFHAGQKAVEK